MDKEKRKSELAGRIGERIRFGKKFFLTDYDGTLAPFNVDRMKAYPYPAVKELLRKIINGRGTYVSVISGRPALEVYDLLDIKPSPEIWGSYGLDRVNPDGVYERTELDQSARRWLEMMRISAAGSRYREKIEIKPFSIALHWRGMEPKTAKEMKRCFFEEFDSFRNTNALIFSDFDGGIELSLSMANKGRVIDRILPNGKNDCFAVYLGDDFSDEEIFKNFKKRKNSIGILARKEWRESNADYWLVPPDDIVWFLEKWLISDEE